ncbi:MAG TPA: hypothetical protein VER32_04630, partial [Pyrinomonadaceae bacterium]|nr:hypothetical protein [Pyrinomonadaceae bacterium]
GLEEEEGAEIPGAARVERLLQPFAGLGHQASVPSITAQKTFVEEQRARFADFENYPHALSPRLRALRDELTARMREDTSGWQQVLTTPDSLAARD